MILFVMVFASCEKEEGIYADEKDFNLVTDINGDKVLSKDGELLVYATDEDGEYVTDDSGERVTMAQQFQPLENDGVVEDYGFKIVLPEGWETEGTKVNAFINKKKNEACEIKAVQYLYDDYYDINKDVYEELQENNIEVTWEDEVDLGEDFGKACRITMTHDGQISVLYFFENSGNVYKVLFSAEKVDSKSFIVDTVTFCKAIEFKNFAYYTDVTAMSEKDN